MYISEYWAGFISGIVVVFIPFIAVMIKNYFGGY